jgi:hypothetical protein
MNQQRKSTKRENAVTYLILRNERLIGGQRRLCEKATNETFRIDDTRRYSDNASYFVHRGLLDHGARPIDVVVAHDGNHSL